MKGQNRGQSDSARIPNGSRSEPDPKLLRPGVWIPEYQDQHPSIISAGCYWWCLRYLS